jgi:hypothetical protein
MMALEMLEMLEDDLDDEALESDDLYDIESLLEDFDDDESFEGMEDDDLESAERKRRRRRRRTSSATRQKKYYDRKLRGYCTKQECKSMAQRISKDIAGVKKVVSRNSGRLSSAARMDSRQNMAIRDLRKEMQSAQQMTMMMTLLEPTTKTFTAAVDLDTIDAGKAFTVTETRNSFDMLLPFLMTSGSSGKGGMSMDNPLMLMVLMQAMNPPAATS